MIFDLEVQGYILFLLVDYVGEGVCQNHLPVTSSLQDIVILVHLHYDLDLCPLRPRSHFVPMIVNINSLQPFSR